MLCLNGVVQDWKHKFEHECKIFLHREKHRFNVVIYVCSYVMLCYQQSIKIETEIFVFQFMRLSVLVCFLKKAFECDKQNTMFALSKHTAYTIRSDGNVEPCRIGIVCKCQSVLFRDFINKLFYQCVAQSVGELQSLDSNCRCKLKFRRSSSPRSKRETTFLSTYSYFMLLIIVTHTYKLCAQRKGQHEQ